MKKLLLPGLLASIMTTVQAQNKLLEIVVPCNAGCAVYSGAYVFSQFAEKRGIKILLMPRGHSSIDYMLERKLPFIVTVGEMAERGRFDEVQPITELWSGHVVLVTNKDTGLDNTDSVANYEKVNPGKLNWFQAGNIQAAMINSFAKQHNISTEQITFIPYKDTKFINDLARNDVNIGFVPPNLIEPIKHKVSVIELSEKIKHQLEKNRPIVAMFLPKTAAAADVEFWRQLARDFLNDQESNRTFEKQYKIPGTFGIDTVMYQYKNWNTQ